MLWVPGFIKNMNKNNLVVALFYFFWCTFFIWFWLHAIYYDEVGNLTSATPMIWADWAMHTSQVHSFYYRGLIESLNQNHIYAYSPLTYPFLTNLVTAILMKLGLGLIAAYIIPSIFFSCMLLVALYRLGKVLFNDPKTAVLGSSLFLTGGGLGFVYFIQDFIKNPDILFFISPPREYTRLIPEGIHWYSTLIATFIPQRAMLMGMPIAILLLSFILQYYKEGFSKITPQKLFILGLGTGALAWIHTHSFIALVLICFVMFLLNVRQLIPWVYIGMGISIPFLPFIIRLKSANLDNFLQWYPGWLVHNPDIRISWFKFWILNWGIFLPCFLLALYGINKTKNALAKKTAFSFIFLFIISNLYIFQPSDWDNVKLLMWVYCGFSFYIAWWLIHTFKYNLLKKVFFAILVFILSFSGFLDLLYLLNFDKHTHVMMPQSEIKLAKQLITISQPRDLILTSDYHLHWVPVMTGRPILMGYRGWLWSYGVDYGQREREIKEMYEGSDDAQDLLKKYQISYVVIGPDEKRQYKANIEYFSSRFPLVLRDSDTLVFDTRSVMP
jgi:hypothetical protein